LKQPDRFVNLFLFDIHVDPGISTPEHARALFLNSTNSYISDFIVFLIMEKDEAIELIDQLNVFIHELKLGI